MGDIESRHFDKAFIRRFVLDIRKLRNFQELSELSNDECPRDVFIRTPLEVICEYYIILHILIGRTIFISVWASRCIVQQFRAMRRPPDVERATRDSSTLF